MHEPVGSNRVALVVSEFAAVKAVAVDPETQSAFIFDAEIIPRQRLTILLPPFHRNPPGAPAPHHDMVRPPPGEMMRRSTRNHRERHLDRLRPFEQPQRP